MKKFAVAELVELDVNKTAFGPSDPNRADSDKYAVLDDNGNVVGWEELYGESAK